MLLLCAHGCLVAHHLIPIWRIRIKFVLIGRPLWTATKVRMAILWVEAPLRHPGPELLPSAVGPRDVVSMHIDILLAGKGGLERHRQSQRQGCAAQRHRRSSHIERALAVLQCGGRTRCGRHPSGGVVVQQIDLVRGNDVIEHAGLSSGIGQ